MSESFFKISIIDGAINLNKQRPKYPNKNINEIIGYLQNGPASLSSYDYNNAIILAKKIGWEAFSLKDDRQSQLRDTLKNMIIQLRPFWAKVSYLGRAKVKHILCEDSIQCLQYAGLLAENPTEDVINWWEEISKIFRIINDEQKLKIGREGEKRTLQLEKQRILENGLNKEPRWIALEDNTVGYDILSYRKNHDNELYEIKIEVKACSFSPTHLILTRNEWKTALENKNTYFFQIWNLDVNQLIEMNVSEMACHIPKDQGDGEWKEVEVILHGIKEVNS
ncbi:protein NO VEIN domain-containing protein [Bacillus salipaludis]|uniref:Protein NO VEIN domain-containing protein n=1 Tax=Bacillus salipaludis TaxID=2547811 RepID=A0ABW8RGG6_9BACI